MVQLSAFNTPQFLWGRVHLPCNPQPVPPIFDPGVAAEGIHFAAGAKRREVCVGFPALKAIVGNKVAPGLGDRILLRSGYAGQMTDTPVSPDRPDNLYSPAIGNYGTTGPFGDRARQRSWQLVATMHRSAVVVLVLSAFAVIGALVWMLVA